MFHTSLNRIKLRQSEARSRHNVKDQERLKRLESALRLTRPFEVESTARAPGRRKHNGPRGPTKSSPRARGQASHLDVGAREERRNHLNSSLSARSVAKPVKKPHGLQRIPTGERTTEGDSRGLPSKRKKELMLSLLGEHQEKRGATEQAEVARTTAPHTHSSNIVHGGNATDESSSRTYGKIKASRAPRSEIAGRTVPEPAGQSTSTRHFTSSAGAAASLAHTIAETLLTVASQDQVTSSRESNIASTLGDGPVESGKTGTTLPKESAGDEGRHREQQVIGQHSDGKQDSAPVRPVSGGGAVTSEVSTADEQSDCNNEEHLEKDAAQLIGIDDPGVAEEGGHFVAFEEIDIAEDPNTTPKVERDEQALALVVSPQSKLTAPLLEHKDAGVVPENSARTAPMRTYSEATGAGNHDMNSYKILAPPCGHDCGMESTDDSAALESTPGFRMQLASGLGATAPASVGRWLLPLRAPKNKHYDDYQRGPVRRDKHDSGDPNMKDSTAAVSAPELPQGSAPPSPQASLPRSAGGQDVQRREQQNREGSSGPAESGDDTRLFLRRLQLTSKKTVLDQATPARFEFVDNDHGMQFVNWRTFSGERLIEKFWENSLHQSDARDRQRFEQEVQSKILQEYEFAKRKQQIWQAMGKEPADDDIHIEQLAQHYYNAMQAALHGPKEDILTGQAFGRYIPSPGLTPIPDLRNKVIYGPWALNWNRATTSRTTRVSLGGRRGAISVGSSAASYVTTANINWNRTAVTFAARPNDQAVKLGILRGRYGVDVARSNRLRTSAVETVMRYVETATVVDQINRTYGQRVRVRRFSFNYTRDFTIPRFDSPGRTPGLRQELAVNWGSLGISVGTDVPDNEYAISVGLRGYQFSVLRDFFQRLTQFQGNWGRGWQLEIATKFEDPISNLVYYQVGFGRLGRLYATAGAGIGSENTPMALVQVQGNDASVAFKAVQEAGVRVFNIGFTVGRFTYSWDSVVEYERVALPLSPIDAVLKTLLKLTP
ncbi:hypothetical protein BESB_047400 [Besnoitia besnoiti]|uniref:Uncharacterized protein n=1 Tax=Besnoitia besnoiti TaxID=94643 RepID=A0A2A9MDG9_BESBE|nr:hypothetical protein BESB_047400 [Besnoitia besnoiti]PFH36548.1 hypothetical protein BESB_047400 [Besnoitia besnoiti]